MKNIIKNAMILTVITLVSGLLLGFVYDITKEPIAKAKEQAKNEAYQTVMQEAGELTQKAPYEVIVNNSFAKKVIQ